MPKIKIVNRRDSEEVEISPVVSLLNNFLMKGVKINTRCGGKGNCCLCAVKVLSGREFMSPLNERELAVLDKKALEDGVRLACQSYALQDLELFIPNDLDEIKALVNTLL